MFEIQKIRELHYLLINDPNQNYYHTITSSSKQFNHLQKCVIKTKKYSFLEDYIDEYLFKFPKEINYQNSHGLTALMIACLNFDRVSTYRTIQILLKHTENINLKDNNGNTALMHACFDSGKKGCHKIIKLLLEHGANVNAMNIHRVRSIHYAITGFGYRKYINKTLKILLDHNANIYYEDRSGRTVITYAISLYIHNRENSLNVILPTRKDFVRKFLISRQNALSLFDSMVKIENFDFRFSFDLSGFVGSFEHVLRYIWFHFVFSSFNPAISLEQL